MKYLSILGFCTVFLLFACKSDVASTEEATVVNDNEKGKKHPAKIDAKKERPKKDPMVTGGMKWMSIEEAEKKGNKEGKKYLVDVYTDWCGWCKIMDKKTFSDPEMQKYLTSNFHLIKFNAEQKEPVSFKGKTYKWEKTGKKGINRLTVDLLGSRLSYPTIVYLDENMKKIKSSPGYKDPEKLMSELKSL